MRLEILKNGHNQKLDSSPRSKCPINDLIIPIVAADALCEELADPRHKRVACTPQKGTAISWCMYNLT
jgi:hypothetical protein